VHCPEPQFKDNFAKPHTTANMLETIISAIGVTNKYYLDVGCEPTQALDSLGLGELGWNGLDLTNTFAGDSNTCEAAESPRPLTVDTILNILRGRDCPLEFDLLSTINRVDGFHVLRFLLQRYSPRVVATSYNPSLGFGNDLVAAHLYETYPIATNHAGSSFNANCALAARFGYTWLCSVSLASTIFFVRQDCAGLIQDLRSDATWVKYDDESKLDNLRYLTSAHYLMDGVEVTHSSYGHISYFKNDEFIGKQLARGVYWEHALLLRVAPLISHLNGLALDIGAHVGTHAIALAQRAPGLSFVCYEPQRPLFLLLERNIVENHLQQRIRALCSAVGHTSAQATLSKTTSDGISRGREIEYGSARDMNLGGIQLGSGGQSCPLVSIDDQSLADIRYVKIDAEGSESLVLEGMKTTLRANMPIVLYEDRKDRSLQRDVIQHLGSEPESFEEAEIFLQARGYCLEWQGANCIGIPALGGVVRKPADYSIKHIPRRLFQLWKSKHNIPANWRVWSVTFDYYNPTYVHDLWDAEDSRSFISREFPWFLNIYDAYPTAAYRMDVVRYFYLYNYGGIYADLDTECLKPLDEVLCLGDIIFGHMGTDRAPSYSIPNIVMASRPHQVFWLIVMQLLIQSGSRPGQPEEITGSLLLRAAVDLYLASDPETALKYIGLSSVLLKGDQQPEAVPSRLLILDPRRWYGISPSNPVHQRLRQRASQNEVLDRFSRTILFSDSWMMNYSVNRWE
jgi:inositol phosphorylceramide mannosyltransferase catalytic subunit